jgi:hypothetical protein
MTTLRNINLGVRFLLELASLAAFAYWGATIPASTPVRTIAAIGAPIAVGVFWGLFISPKARIPTGRAGRAGLGLLVFLGAAATLQARGHSPLSLTFAVVSVLSSVVVYALPQ